MHENQGVLKSQAVWTELLFYKKTVCLYDITYYFVKQYLKLGDRTIDQMVQAARSGKQNIVEGAGDGMTSSEMELKLLNVARSSILELRQDYEDYLRVRNLTIWNANHSSFDKMLDFCRTHNQSQEYTTLLPRMTDEKIANMALTLCHIVDKMMMSYQRKLENNFIQQGGIRERMTAARTGFRNNYQNNEIIRLQETNRQLLSENLSLKQQILSLQGQSK